MPKPKNTDESTQPQSNADQQRIEELTLDLQRTRADFENYRKRVDAEKDAARELGKASAILKLLPVVDNIERAIAHTPEHLAEDKWAQGVAGLTKGLDKSLEQLGLSRIVAEPGVAFDPSLHEAVSMDEESEGEREVIVEVLQAGYMLEGKVLRHCMVRVGRA